MILQTLCVAVLVCASAVYAVWQLMPAALRVRLAARLAGAPLPAGLRSYFLAAGQSSGCSGCGTGCKPAAATTQAVTFHRRKPH